MRKRKYQRVHAPLIVQLFASVLTASRLRTTVNISRLGYRVEHGWDAASLAGIFGDHDAAAYWDFTQPAHGTCLPGFQDATTRNTTRNRRRRVLWRPANQCMGLL